MTMKEDTRNHLSSCTCRLCAVFTESVAARRDREAERAIDDEIERLEWLDTDDEDTI